MDSDILLGMARRASGLLPSYSELLNVVCGVLSTALSHSISGSTSAIELRRSPRSFSTRRCPRFSLALSLVAAGSVILAFSQVFNVEVFAIVLFISGSAPRLKAARNVVHHNFFRVF
jgi:hypothetical protein